MGFLLIFLFPLCLLWSQDGRNEEVTTMLMLLTFLGMATTVGFASHHLNLYPVVDIEPLPLPPHVQMPILPVGEVQTLLAQAQLAMAERTEIFEPDIQARGVTLTPNTPAWFMSISRTSLPTAKNLTNVALVAEEVTKYISQVYGLTREQICYGLTQIDVRETNLGRNCPIQVDYPCQPKKYRAYSGYCNNVQSPRWGNSNTRFLRYLPSDYADYVSLPRGGGIQNSTLPSARDVSLIVHKDSDLPHNHLMAVTAVWGQFIAHEIAHAPQISGYKGSRLKCCAVNFSDFHPECFPIRLPDDDPVHGKLGERCQDYARSATAPRTGCTFGPREQLNQVTSFLDGSAIYGSSKAEAESLREFSDGKLKTQRSFTGKPLLPPSANLDECRRSGGHKCFRIGDVRANEHVGLAALYTLWAREHNRLAEALKSINPHWRDETLFQEARRIVAAEIQHITYNEYLPMILGQEIVDKFGLTLQPFGFFTGYDININAGTANSVAAAALNFISSLMPKSVDIYDTQDHKVGQQNLVGTFYAPFSLYESGGLDKVLRGLLHEPAQREDSHINEIMTNHMFQESSSRSGLDLAAQIIQMGRDHGIPAYHRWREFCHFSKITRFSDLEGIMPSEAIVALQRVYRNVSDIDLFTGALSELPMPGAVVGPTLACLLGRQFHYLRRGDRYWYENDLPPSSFTQEQLNEIRKVTLARIICDNSDNIKEVQPEVFLDKDPFLNAVMPCHQGVIKEMNLSPWKETRRTFHVSDKVITDLVKRAKKDVSKIIEQEKDLYEQKKTADPLSPVGTAYGFNRPKRQAAEIANTSLVLQLISKRFVNSFLQGQLQDQETGFNAIEPHDLQELMEALPNVDLTDILEVPRVFSCDEQTLPCDHTNKYRSITGWCNNLKNPGRGKSLRAFARLLPPKYDDGVGSPRTRALDGRPLPSPRLISTRMHPDFSRPHVRYSLMFMQFAQLLDHDLTHTPVNKAFVGEAILDCRPCDAMITVHPECFPIPIPEGDPYFPRVNITTGQPLCIPVTRSMPGQLTLGYREQLNQVTAYIDSSFVYGSDVCESKILRSFSGGRLNTTVLSRRLGKPLMPQITTHPECKNPSKICFRGGDARASEQPGLTAMHTIFLREHNRLADALHQLNPHWNDETLYQQARRIISATTQHITFSELLPRIFGWDGVHKYKLTLQSEGYSSSYDPHCDATLVNEFASAAFRFGHSLLKPSLLRLDGNYNVKEPVVRLRDTFFNPEVIYQQDMIDELLRGLATTAMETLDPFITNEVTNHLFEDRRMPYSGMDLAAINIQRGRDHGIRGYNDYREFCNMTRARTFDDLKKEIASPVVESLRRIYGNVDDIDLFPGGLSETPLKGGVVGPTFSCIIGEQFQRLKKCDRFWYENDDSLVRFTEAQLMEIRKMTLAKLVCDNSDKMTSIQRHIMDLPDPFLNPIVPCTSLPSINLEPWKERQTCTVGGVVIDVGAAKRISPCIMCTCTKEGPVCQSLKIVNCFHLARSFPQESLLSDHVCKVQCAYVLRALPRVLRLESKALGFT